MKLFWYMEKMFDESNSDSYLVQGRCTIIIHRIKLLLSFWFYFVEKSVGRILYVGGGIVSQK